MRTLLWENEIDPREAADAFMQAWGRPVRRALLIPPDITRACSGAGEITRVFYEKLDGRCDVLPALGTHRPMSRAEQTAFFGAGIPAERYITHNWRADTVTLGHIPAGLMETLSGGYMREAVPVEVNKRLAQGGYDLILSVGQVVPHEVVGMANYTKNILVGCGGAGLIHASHMLSVYTDYEKYLGRDHSPVRQMLDYAQEHFLTALPLVYVMTVVHEGRVKALTIGRDRDGFERAVALSRRHNIIRVPSPITTCVVRLDPGEFRTAWLGNKAIYRTRKALARGARLLILAPGFERFGEDAENDRLIRKYGYRGREETLRALAAQPDLAANLSVAAHLIQGSTEGRFTVTYCTPPRYESDIRAAGYDWQDIDTAAWGADAYYIDNPALGLWVYE